MPEISVIIPTYNRESLLLRALISVVRQSIRCSEIIVVDDGSEDNTKACVQDFAEESIIPVRYLYQENKGPAAARNRGIVEAHSPYIAFLDSDDHWKKKKLEIQYRALSSRPECLISHTQEKWLRRGEHLNQKKIHQPGNGDIFQHCLRLCAVGMSTVMVKSTLFSEVGLFNEDLPCCEDYDLWLRTSSLCQFLLIEKPLTVKEGGREDQVSFLFRVGMDRLRIVSILNLLKEKRLLKKQMKMALEELERKCLVYGKGCLKHKKRDEGWMFLKIAEWAQKTLGGDINNSLIIPHIPESFLRH